MLIHGISCSMLSVNCFVTNFCHLLFTTWLKNALLGNAIVFIFFFCLNHFDLHWFLSSKFTSQFVHVEHLLFNCNMDTVAPSYCWAKLFIYAVWAADDDGADSSCLLLYTCKLTMTFSYALRLCLYKRAPWHSLEHCSEILFTDCVGICFSGDATIQRKKLLGILFYFEWLLDGCCNPHRWDYNQAKPTIRMDDNLSPSCVLLGLIWQKAHHRSLPQCSTLKQVNWSYYFLSDFWCCKLNCGSCVGPWNDNS